MFSKLSLLAVFVAAAQLVAAVPPACFLAAINQQQTLNDFDTICGENSGDVQKSIQGLCSGDNTKAALDAFSSACKAKGKEVGKFTLSLY
jgi:hypothetical protein